MQGNRAPLVLFGVGDNQFGISVWPADLNGDLSLLSPSLSQSGAFEVRDSQHVADANSLFSPYNWSFPLCHQDTAKAKKYHLGVLSWFWMAPESWRTNIMISTNQSTIYRGIWTNESGPLCLSPLILLSGHTVHWLNLTNFLLSKHKQNLTVHSPPRIVFWQVEFRN